MSPYAYWATRWCLILTSFLTQVSEVLIISRIAACLTYKPRTFTDLSRYRKVNPDQVSHYYPDYERDYQILHKTPLFCKCYSIMKGCAAFSILILLSISLILSTTGSRSNTWIFPSSQWLLAFRLSMSLVRLFMLSLFICSSRPIILPTSSFRNFISASILSTACLFLSRPPLTSLLSFWNSLTRSPSRLLILVSERMDFLRFSMSICISFISLRIAVSLS